MLTYVGSSNFEIKGTNQSTSVLLSYVGRKEHLSLPDQILLQDINELHPSQLLPSGFRLHLGAAAEVLAKNRAEMEQEKLDRHTYHMEGGDGPYSYAKNSNYQVIYHILIAKFNIFICTR